MIKKLGTAESILEVAKSAEEFSVLWSKIEKENNLIKCSNCKHLLSKKSEISSLVQSPTSSTMMTATLNTFTIKHHHIAAVVVGGTIRVICPTCNTINQIN